MEKKKNVSMKLGIALAMAALLACFGLVACNGGGSNGGNGGGGAEVGGGFEETPIFEDITAGGWLNVSAVYFQPVPMTDGSTIEGKDIHLEADIHALENEFGFGIGDWVPYLTVSYKVTNEAGAVAASGTFMVMSASDGPHYGANIALPKAGTYTIEITIGSPADNNYLLHTDSETGPGAQSFNELPDGSKWPLVITETWDYVPLEY